MVCIYMVKMACNLFLIIYMVYQTIPFLLKMWRRNCKVKPESIVTSYIKQNFHIELVETQRFQQLHSRLGTISKFKSLVQGVERPLYAQPVYFPLGMKDNLSKNQS